MIDVICYGIVCLDYIWRVPRLPGPGGGVNIDEEAAMIGGEAINTAYALHQWGVKLTVVANALGEDERSLQLRHLLNDAFGDTDSLVIPHLPEAVTPFCTCIATPDGHRTMFGKDFGPRIHLPLDSELAASARFLTIDSTGYREAGKEAVILAAECGANIVAMDCEEIPEICDRADTIQVSSEHFDFHGSDGEEEKLLEWAVAKRYRHGAHVLVTFGPHGCIVAEQGGPCYTVPAYPVECVIDSTGSGDVFRAGYLYGRVQGWEMRRTLQFASAAASFNCCAMGGCGGIAPLETILSRIEAAEPASVSPI
jgi:sugar/nucleoside kinase (ribokinase family)